MKVNFRKIKVEINFEGDIVEIDVRKQLGNAIRQSTNDIGFEDFARKIYYSEGEIEVPDEYIQPIKDISKQVFIVPAQRAINELLDK